MNIQWRELVQSLFGNRVRSATVAVRVDVNKIEAIEALKALDIVGGAEVSPEVARQLGAFEERAISLDDIIDDAG